LFDVSGSAFGTSVNPIVMSGSLSTTTVAPAYGTTGSLTITIASLTNASARASTVVDNTSTKFDDVFIFVKTTSAAAATSATGYVNIWGYAGMSGQTTFAEGFVGTDAALTMSSPPNLQMIGQVTVNANSKTYWAGPFSFCRTYGLERLPPQWGIVFENRSGATLNATAGNHSITWQGVNGKLI
jgi:hypothetical protein